MNDLIPIELKKKRTTLICGSRRFFYLFIFQWEITDYRKLLVMELVEKSTNLTII